jgi:type IV pilus assembly protein PilE
MSAIFRKESGVTLIELMIVILIVGILAAISYPAYTGYVARGNRAAARACTAEMAQFMERYYTTNLTYVGAAPVLGCQSEGGLDARYTLTADTLAQNTYRLVATPIGAQLSQDTECAELTQDQAGARTISGTGNTSECWSR